MRSWHHHFLSPQQTSLANQVLDLHLTDDPQFCNPATQICGAIYYNSKPNADILITGTNGVTLGSHSANMPIHDAVGDWPSEPETGPLFLTSVGPVTLNSFSLTNMKITENATTINCPDINLGTISHGTVGYTMLVVNGNIAGCVVRLSSA